MKENRLTSRVLRVAELHATLVRQLYAIFERHYDCVDWMRFEGDLSEKDYVLVLMDSRTGEPRGFSTQKILTATVHGLPVRAVFSGDTVIDRAYWGEQELVRCWCRFAGQVRAEEPETRLFWFLISKGFRTYLYLPLFYRDFYPRYDRPTPVFEQAVMDTLAGQKFLHYYNPRLGLVEFPEALGQLTPELAEIPPGRLDDPHVQFFLTRNPRYAEGVELVCLTEISPQNMRGLAARMGREGEESGSLQRISLHA